MGAFLNIYNNKIVFTSKSKACWNHYSAILMFVIFFCQIYGILFFFQLSMESTKIKIKLIDKLFIIFLEKLIRDNKLGTPHKIFWIYLIRI